MSVDLSKVNAEGREIASAVARELDRLREDVATFLRYMESVDEKLAPGRGQDVEVAQNILSHQRRNLRRSVERTGPITSSGHASKAMHIP